MNCRYDDITSLIPGGPDWWDEHAVPRYCQFSPDRIANIYADEACLCRIACQNCGHEFMVALSYGRVAFDNLPSLSKRIDWLHYGDPPNNCCQAGATMNSEMLEVVEFWVKEGFVWTPRSDLRRTYEEEK